MVNSEAALVFRYPYEFTGSVGAHWYGVFNGLLNALGNEFSSFVGGGVEIPFVLW